MLVSLGIYVRRGQRTVKRWLMDPRLHTFARGVGCLLVGFVCAATSLGNHFQPVALGILCASTGFSSVLLALGAVAGYLTFWGMAGVQGAVWVLAGLLATVILGGRRILQTTPLLMPVLSGLIVALTGLAFQVFWADTTAVGVYLLRIALAAAGTWVFSLANQRRDPVVQWLCCFFGVLALAQITVTPYLGLGYVGASLLACMGPFPAAALGGLALDLAQITPVPMTAVMSLAYLSRLLPRGPKWLHCTAPVLVYGLVMGLCGTWDLLPVAGLCLGGLGAFATPGKTDVSRRRGETGAAQVQLELVSGVLHQAQSLLQMIEEAPIDEEVLIARASERACNSCPCRKTCREKGQSLTTDLLHKPLGNGEDLPAGCRKTGRLLQELRRSQEQLRTIRADRDRRREYHYAVVQQYGFLADYLQDVSDSLAKRKDPAVQWYQPEVAVCSASRERSNGDRCLWFAGVECRYYLLLCDGMGTGEEAAREGKRAGYLLKKLLCAGYPAQYALRTVNSLCALQGKAGIVTVDLAELHLDTGKATLYKWGAAPSYLVARGEPIKIGTATPPPGLSVTEGRESVERLSLRRGETLVLLSDGAGGEEALRTSWERPSEPAGELAARILDASRQEGCDDATVAVVRLNAAPVST